MESLVVNRENSLQQRCFHGSFTKFFIKKVFFVNRTPPVAASEILLIWARQRYYALFPKAINPKLLFL